MIKLIASDLDGTLLQHGNSNISSRMINMIEALYQKGILFVAASGRQYSSLLELFQPVNQHMAFICENGSLVMYQGQVISKLPMDRNLSLEVLEDIWNRDNCEILLSTEDTAYLKPKKDSYVDEIKNHFKYNITLTDDFASIKEDFIKIAVYEEAGIADNSGAYFMNKWQDKFKCTISGYAFMDFTDPRANKGNALNLLLNKLSISPSEAMAFGDNYNDLEMLSLVKYGYVMENAVEDIKSRFSYHTKQVEDTISNIFELNI